MSNENPDEITPDEAAEAMNEMADLLEDQVSVLVNRQAKTITDLTLKNQLLLAAAEDALTQMSSIALFNPGQPNEYRGLTALRFAIAKSKAEPGPITMYWPGMSAGRGE